MSNTNSYSKLQGGSLASFDSMLRHFGVVTVMNAKVYEYQDVLDALQATDLSAFKCDAILKAIETQGAHQPKVLCTLNTLKIANVSLEGPTKTVTGGQYSNPILKFGKTATMEIQDALGNADAIEALGGGVVEHFGYATHDETSGNADVLHIGSDFASVKTIVGESFFIDTKTGQQVKVNIIFYQFSPDSLFNLTQDSEGDATVFDMNGSLLTTDITIGTDSVEEHDVIHGVFYSVMAKGGPVAKPVATFYTLNAAHTSLTLAAGYSGRLNGEAIAEGGSITVEPGDGYRLEVLSGADVVYDEVILVPTVE